MKRRTPNPPPPRLPYPQTPDTARAWIHAHGICVADLARRHALPRAILVDLLRGRIRGLRGSAHLAAIVLGLKQDPDLVEAQA